MIVCGVAAFGCDLNDHFVTTHFQGNFGYFFHRCLGMSGKSSGVKGGLFKRNIDNIGSRCGGKGGGECASGRGNGRQSGIVTALILWILLTYHGNGIGLFGCAVFRGDGDFHRVASNRQVFARYAHGGIGILCRGFHVQRADAVGYFRFQVVGSFRGRKRSGQITTCNREGF